MTWCARGVEDHGMWKGVFPHQKSPAAFLLFCGSFLSEHRMWLQARKKNTVSLLSRKLIKQSKQRNLAAHADDSLFDRELVMTRLVKIETSFQWFQTSFSKVEHDYINCMDSWMQIPLFRGKLSIAHGRVTPVQYSTIHYNWFTTPIFVGSTLHLAILDHFGVSPVSPLSPLPP